MRQLLTLLADIQDALALLVKRSIKELIDQGHKASGRGIASFETRTYETIGGFIGEILVNDYIEYQDLGRRPGKRPPIGPLINWARIVKPGLSEAETKSFAFAVATAIEREGMPTRGAYSYTANGRRKEWTRFALAASEIDVESILSRGQWLEREIELAFAKTK